MRKLFTLLLAVLFVSATFAQSLQPVQVPMRKMTDKVQGFDKGLRSQDIGWVTYVSYLYNFFGGETALPNGIPQGAGNILSIDTLGLTEFSDGEGGHIWDHPWILSVGQTYDLNSDFYDMVSEPGDVSLTYSTSLNIDSIAIQGLYLRSANLPASVVDTLIVGILPNAEDYFSGGYHYPAYENTCFWKIDHDINTGVAQHAQVIKVPLTAADVSEPAETEGSYYYAEIDIPVNISNITTKTWQIAYTFKSGSNIGLNDTIDNFSEWHFATWKNPGDQFEMSYYYTNNLESRCTDKSHGGFVCAFTNGVSEYYYPGFMLSESMHYPRIYMKVSCNDCAFVNVEEMEKENITVYPNPATNKFTVNLAGSEKANIELFNLVGQRVYNGTATDKAEINVANFRAGIYMLKVSQNGKVYTSKVVVK